MRTRRPSHGFTLIEVLVALVIVGVALGAALRAVGTVTDASSAVESRLLAQWSAENRLVEMRLQHLWPDTGVRGFACPQGAHTFFCEETITNTANPAFRRVEVAVYASPEKSVRLAQLINAVANPTSNVQ